jgi:hypothetical protein
MSGHLGNINRLQVMLAHNGIDGGHRGNTSVRYRRRLKSDAQNMPVRAEAVRQSASSSRQQLIP